MARCRRLDSLKMTLPELRADRDLQVHVGSCRTCAALLPLLPDEISAIRSSGPGADDVAIRRLRQRLLVDLDAGVVAIPIKGRNSRRGLVVAVGLVAGAAALTIVFWATMPVRMSASQSLATVVPSDSVTARWSQRVLGRTEEISLENGTFRVKVKEHPDDRHVVFRLPDGEIEDLGTVFDVVVASGQTRQVAVESGQVVLRLRDTPPVSLSSGALWSQPADVTSLMAPAKVFRPLRPATSGALEHRSRRTPAVALPPLASSPQSGVLSAPEDAAYLHVVQLLRASRMTEARNAAADYLRRFPQGFRSDEMRELVNH